MRNDHSHKGIDTDNCNVHEIVFIGVTIEKTF